MSYLVSGNNPAAIKTAERNIFVALAGQTIFTISQGYQPGDIDVYLNGVRLVDSDDYYATNGSTVVLTSGATVGDSLVVVCYRPYQVTDFYTKSEQDTRYVNATGDTITGPVVINSAGNDRLQITSGTQSVYLGLDSNGAAIAGGAGQTGPGVYLYNTEGSVNLFTNNTLRLKVDSSGRMTNPYQPAFATINTSYTQTSNGWSKIIAGSEQFDIGSNYDLPNGKFTAPVSGRYIFTFWGLSYPHAAADVNQVQLRKNGSQYGDSVQFGGSSVNHALCSGSIMANLSQNDYVELWFYGASSSKAYAGQWNMCGYLIS